MVLVYDTPVEKSAFAQFILNKHFKLDRNRFQVDRGILNLLMPDLTINANSPTEFVEVKYLPKTIFKFISSETLKYIEGNLRSKDPRKDFRQQYFDESFSRLYAELQYAYKDYWSFKRHYCDLDNWDLDKVETTAALHSMMEVILRYWNAKTFSNKQMIYEVLLKFVNDLEENTSERTSTEDIQSVDVRMPSKSFDSFRHYIKRVDKKGLPQAFIHGLTKKTSNRLKLNSFMKDLIILLVMENPVNSSAEEIRAVLDDVANDHPELVKREIFHHLGSSTIRNFLASKESKSNISYAKDDFREFKRAILGYLRMTPASAPLVRICIDGYVAQVVCQGFDEDGKKVIMQLVCVIVMDARTKAVLGIAIGETEHSTLILQAIKEYFFRARGCAPREIVMDGHAAYQSGALERFRKEMEGCGVKLTFTNKNPNRNPIERALRQFQDKVLGHTFSYIGASIRSRGKNALPSKAFLITVRNKQYLKSKEETTKILYWLFRQVYNQQSLNAFGYYPNEQFSSEAWSIQKEFDRSQIARMLHNWHKATICGCGVIIKESPMVYIYKDRSPEIAEKGNEEICEVFVDPDNRDEAYLFKQGEKKHFCTMKLIAEIPSAEFDRTEEHYDYLKHYAKETRNIIEHFYKSHQTKEAAVNQILNNGEEYGAKDFRDYTTRAKQKKDFDTQDTSFQIGLAKPTKEPVKLFHANKSTYNRKGKRNGSAGMQFISTM